MSSFNRSFDIDALQELIQLAYDASLEPKLWHRFTEVLSKKTNSAYCTFWQHYFEGDKEAFMYMYNMDPAYLPSYRDYYGAMDEFNTSFCMQRKHEVALSHQWVDYSDIVSSEIYNDWMKPQEIYYVAAGRVERMSDDRGFVYISLGNNESGGYITEEAASLIQALLPHLRKAIIISDKIAVSDQYSLQLERLYSKKNVAMLLTDDQGRPVFLNEVAEVFLDKADSLLIKGGVITATCSHANKKLHQAIDAVSRSYLTSSAAINSIAIERKAPLAPLTVIVMPFSQRVSRVNESLTNKAKAMVLIYEEKPCVNLSPSLLYSLYGLTTSESRIVNELVNGSSVKEISNIYGVSELTVRVQIKSIFQKTKVNRQTDLVSKMLLGPASAAFS